MKELETKGYTIIKGFLNPEVVEQIKTDYYTQVELFKINNPNSNYKAIPSKCSVTNQINPVLKEIANTTNITVDYVDAGGTYWDNQLIQFAWHQDHEPYYMWQDSYNALNFWIPIIKPNSNISGLSIIPQDRLLELCPDVFKKRIEGKGAKTLIKINKMTLMIDDDNGDKVYLNFDLDNIAITPELNPGDLLLIRQDVFHKTEDNIDNRVALSVRAFNSNTILYKEKVFNGCAKKQEIIKKNPAPYKKILQYFEDNNLTECKLAEIRSVSKIF